MNKFVKTFESFNNKVKLPERLIKRLDKEPESGMGYHSCDIILNDGRILKGRIILNSTYLKVDNNEDIKTNDIIDMKI